MHPCYSFANLGIDILLGIIYGVTFYVSRDWQKKQPITGRYQYIYRTISSARVFQTNRPLFPFDINDVTRNFDCWRSRLRVSNNMWRITYEDGYLMRDSTHVGTQISPSSSLWICTDQPPKLYETERTVTKTNTLVKSSENTSFCNYSLLYLSH